MRCAAIFRMCVITVLLVVFLRAGPAFAGKEDNIPKYSVPPPPFSEDIFPCSECHADMEFNPEKRVLEEHVEIQNILNHGSNWCLDCHNGTDRDKLKLASGTLVSFEESYYLCGQCHGTLFRDWKKGVHGKRTGEWNGKKVYRLCVHCHSPHSPRFKPLHPLPPPTKPGDYENLELKNNEIPRNPIANIGNGE